METMEHCHEVAIAPLETTKQPTAVSMEGTLPIGEQSAIWPGDNETLRMDSLVRAQRLMIERIQDLHCKIEQHDQRAATAHQLDAHSKRMSDELASQRTVIIDTLETLHAELRKSSLRHRASIYATVSVGLSTVLALATVLHGSLTIPPSVPILVLLGSLLFWFMARRIPGLPDIREDLSDDRKTT